MNPRILNLLNRSSLKFHILLFVVYYAAASLALLARHDFNPSAMVRFGHDYVRQNPASTPEGALYFTGNEAYGGNGYDGQIFYYYARTLFQKGVWPEGFNNAYRAPRVGYPFLAALFTPFGSWGIVAGMIAVQLALFFAALCMLHRILPEDRKYLVLFWTLSPFSLQSFLFLVSDSVMVSLLVVGYGFYLRTERRPLNLVACYLFFSLAVLTKESSLFFLFPLGLLALFRRDIPRIILMLGVLLPMLLWQFYLRAAHGMIPAGILSIFLEPLDGMFGLLGYGADLVVQFFRDPSPATIVLFIKAVARFILLALMAVTMYALFSGDRRRWLPFRLAALLTLVSVGLADYYYFWSVYENISRMFTVLVPVLILLKAQDREVRSGPFFTLLASLALMVFLRTLLLMPQFPHATLRTYSGPTYPEHTPTLVR